MTRFIVGRSQIICKGTSENRQLGWASRPAPTENGVGVAYRFESVNSDGEILGTFETAEQRWQTGDTVVAHGNRRYHVVSLIPIERISEFVDEPAGGVLEVRTILEQPPFNLQSVAAPRPPPASRRS